MIEHRYTAAILENIRKYKSILRDEKLALDGFTWWLSQLVNKTTFQSLQQNCVHCC